MLVAEMADQIRRSDGRSDVASQATRPPADQDPAAHIKRVLLAIRRVNQLIVREQDPQRLVERACVSLAETLGYFNAWIALLDADGVSVTALAASRLGDAFEPMRQGLMRGKFPSCMRRALAGDATLVVENPKVACLDCPLASQYDGRASFARRLASDGRVLGILVVSIPSAYAQDREELSYFEELATDLALALRKIEMAGELRESEERFREIVEQSNEVFYRQNVNTARFEYVSPRVQAILGYSPAEMLAMGLDQQKAAIHPDDLPGLLSFTEELSESNSRGERTTEREFRLRNKQGEYRWLHGSYTLLRDAQGSPHMIIGSLRDITARKQAEEALRESEHRLRLATKATNDVIWDWDVVHDAQLWNEAGAAVFGWSDIVAAPQTAAWWIERVHPEDVQRVADGFSAAVADPRVLHWRDEYRFRKADGGYAHVVDRGYVLRNADGQAVRMIGAMLDITARKQAEDALRRSERLLKATERLSGIGGWVWDVPGQTMTWTEGTYRIHEFAPDEVPPGSPEHIRRSLACYAPADRERIARAFQRCLDEGEPYDLECAFITATGRQLWVRTMARAVRESGRIVQIIGNLQDITDRKQAEAERARLQAELLQAQKMESVGRLAGGVAHDFNNMLGVILGRAELSLDLLTPAHPLYGNLDEISKAASRSADLTRQLLAFARKQTASPKVLDLNETVAGMVKILQRLIGEDIDLVWSPGPDLWPVHMDPSQIDQILANLCVNARDAIAGVGTVTIETRNAVAEPRQAVHAGEPTAAGDYVQLTVRDTGCGMDGDTVTHLYEPFYTTKEVGKGTGLGLATVYGIVSQNDGFILVDSEPGRGTTFRIYLPRHQAEVSQTAVEDSTGPAVHGRETILLVEDESSILGMATAMLRHLGYTVLATRTPSEALRLVQTHPGPIDLLMTDVVMPEMNGLELAKQAAAIRPQLAHLFMSGYTADVVLHRGLLEDGVPYLPKPFSMKELALRLREVFER